MSESLAHPAFAKVALNGVSQLLLYNETEAVCPHLMGFRFPDLIAQIEHSAGDTAGFFKNGLEVGFTPEDFLPWKIKIVT